MYWQLLSSDWQHQSLALVAFVLCRSRVTSRQWEVEIFLFVLYAEQCIRQRKSRSNNTMYNILRVLVLLSLKIEHWRNEFYNNMLRLWRMYKYITYVTIVNCSRDFQIQKFYG